MLHMLALLLYLDWGEILTNPPVADTDFATHWAAVWSVSHFLDNGHLWGYDPHFMAGHPEGTLFNVDNRLFELGSWLVSQSGLSLPLSYNLILAITILLAPLAVYPATRWLDLGEGDAFLAQAATLALWYLDPTLQWAWQGGIFAFLAVVPLSLLLTAAAARLTDGQSRDGRLVWAIWFGLGPLLFWLHALAFALLVVPLTVLFLTRWPHLSWSRRLALLLWPPLVLLINYPWLAPALRFVWARTETNLYLQGGIPALAADLLGHGYIDGASTVSLLGLRWLVLTIGGVGLWHLVSRKVGIKPVAIGGWVAMLVAYSAVHLPGGGDLQPYRYIMQAAIWSTVGLGAGLQLVGGWLDRVSDRLRRPKQLIILGLSLLAVVWIGNAAWRFRPPPLGGPAYHRWQGPSAELHNLCRYLQTLPLNRGRVLVDDSRIGAMLPWCSGAEVIGGPFFQVWTRYGFSNATPWNFLEVSYRDYTVGAWNGQLKNYNVGWIIAHQAWNHPDWYTLADWLVAHPGIASPHRRFGPYQLYEVSREPLPYQINANHAGLWVDNVSADGLLLPYHWLPSLESIPGTVRLTPEWIGADPIPFIQIDPAGETSFLLCLRHQCPSDLEP